jgi:hypothetical protein
MSKISNALWKWLVGIAILIVLGCLTWRIGARLNWSWADFWSNLISNAASTAIIGFVLYWIITRPDDKKAKQERKNQALALLKIEFKKNLGRARIYGCALEKRSNDLSDLYPLRFTRGAWNALKESGFLPQLDDVKLIYDLLSINEIITTANNNLLKVRNALADKDKKKLKIYAEKAKKECSMIQLLAVPILQKLETMNLPEFILPEAPESDDDDERD